MIQWKLSILAFCAILLFYYLTNSVRVQKILLLGLSLWIYSQFSVFYCIALIIIIITTFLFSEYLSVNKKKQNLVLGIATNVLILAFFKYNYLFGNWHTSFQYPIGLSFYVFQSISYLSDTHKGDLRVKNNMLDVALYLGFFPKILAGPIEKPKNLIPQFNVLHKFKSGTIFIGVKIVLYGLFCKFVLADGLAMMVDRSLLSVESQTGLDVFLVSVLYSFQIYFDFFGYSILAIGGAILFGLGLSQNFDRPYLSLTLKDFWRKWNITLLKWLREYIFIPLGGNRVRHQKYIINILIVFVVSGLWHGATVNFIAWGLLHGLLFLLEKKIFSFKDGLLVRNIVSKIFYVILMYSSISVLWLIFRIDNFNLLLLTFSKIFNFRNWMTFSGNLEIDYLVCALVLIAFVFEALDLFKKYIFQSNTSYRFIFVELIIINLLTLSLITNNAESQGFIYFNF